MSTREKPSKKRSKAVVRISGQITDIAISSGIDENKVSDKFFDMIESDEESLKIIKKSITENSGRNKKG